MLETPKAIAPNIGKMRLDETMDNQQETAKLAGMYRR